MRISQADRVVLAITAVALVAAFLLRPQRRVDLQVFWMTPEQTISEKESVFRSIPLDGRGHRIRIDLAGRGLIRLRIDPAFNGVDFEYLEISGLTLHGRRDGELANVVELAHVVVPPRWHCFNCTLERDGDILRIRSRLGDPHLLSGLLPYLFVDTVTFTVAGK